MITVVGGIKGGSGKTTLATNLVVLHTLANRKTLLIDADDQKSASDWSHQREGFDINTPWTTVRLTGGIVRKQLQKIKEDYDEVVIDTGGRDTTSQRAALTIADILLAPFQPRSFDIWTLRQISALVEEVLELNSKLNVLAVINRADPRGKDNEAAMQMIDEAPYINCLSIVIKQRKSFANAASEGLGIIEATPKDKKAIMEMQYLYQLLYSTNKAPNKHLTDTKVAP